MKKWIALFLILLLACAACFSFAEEDAEELNQRGNEALEAGDKDTAFELFWKAADLGDVGALNNLALMYDNGFGVELSHEKALELYQKAAEQGEEYAMYNLGLMYFNDRGVEKDLNKAIEYFTRAGEAGMAGAWFNLAVLYEEKARDGDTTGYGKAFECWSRNADLGDMDGLFMVGYYYFAGQAVEQSYEKAYEYWQKAAELGSFRAWEALGELYRDGLGVKQDYEKAADLFCKSWSAGGEAEGYRSTMNG